MPTMNSPVRSLDKRLLDVFQGSLYIHVYDYTVILYYWQNNSEASRLGPVVQNVVSLTSSLKVILLTVLADSIYNILIFFEEKM